MPRQKPEYPSMTWDDLTVALPEWLDELKVTMTATIAWTDRLAEGAYVEVVLSERTLGGGGRELVRTRAPYPVRRQAGHAGAIFLATMQAVRELEANPWLWPQERRPGWDG